ncbi:MAG: CinA family protein [Exilibacterium sp.]
MAANITAVAGASAVFEAGFVTYSNCPCWPAWEMAHDKVF